MTELRLDTWRMPTADLGPVNPFPPLDDDLGLDKSADLTDATDEIRANAAYGRVRSISPYLLQDGYGRDRAMQDHPVAVLENEHLRATFLLRLGGRLWSLVDRATGRDLLYTNPILQPANFAVRNAWFAGGVEWNVGTIGHTALTCEPMHAARVDGDDGVPVLRLYEFERMRRVVYQLDVHLPPGSRALYVHVRIVNPNAEQVPVYWWSNIAVPQSAETRVLVPADRHWTYSYDHVVRYEPVVGHGPETAAPDCDISYPAPFSDAADFFFDLDRERTPWIAAVDGSGTGVFQASTRELIGRKLFRWGTATGGRHWQQWLSGPLPSTEAGYAEIQAGLARTQFGHLPMPGDAHWSWTESYGPLVMDPGLAHGPWAAARTAAGEAVTAAVGADALAERHRIAQACADREPSQILHRGSGWGALDRVLRQRGGEPPLDRPGTPFDEATLGEAQQPWLELLDTGVYPDPAPGGMPTSVHLHPVLVDALGESPGWAAPALLGVARAAAGDWQAAGAAWQESLRRTENRLARRNLAVAARRSGDLRAACEHYLAALGHITTPPDDALALTDSAQPAARVSYSEADRLLVIEALGTLIDAGAAEQAVTLSAALPTASRSSGRIRLLEARAALANGEIDRCAEILTDPSLAIADLREGGDRLEDVWWDYQAERLARERGSRPDDALRTEVRATVPLPPHLDFRMHPAASASADPRLQ